MRIRFVAVPLVLMIACGTENGGSDFPAGTDGGVVDLDGSATDAPFFQGADTGIQGDACAVNLTGTLRDLKDDHPDVERPSDEQGDDPNIVGPDLGTDGKPVYVGGAGTKTTHGATAFNSWYHDVAGVNMSSLFTILPVKGANGISTYDNPAFFPLDNMGFGNQGRPHNFHFTFELHTRFVYTGGEVFTFTGDDDLYTFINGHLAINLGGVHSAESKSVTLDDNAAALGLTIGQTYPLDIFSAERHTDESHFRIDTTIQFTNCEPIIR